MGGKAVTQQMGTYGLSYARSLRGFAAGLPQYLGRDGLVGAGPVDGARKHVGLRLHPTPVLTKRLKRLRAQRNVAVLAAFALADVDEHAGAVDVFDLEVAQF